MGKIRGGNHVTRPSTVQIYLSIYNFSDTGYIKDGIKTVYFLSTNIAFQCFLNTLGQKKLTEYKLLDIICNSLTLKVLG